MWNFLLFLFIPISIQVVHTTSYCCNFPRFVWWRMRQGSHFFYPIKFPDFSLTFPWFPKTFPWFFLSFHQDILVKKTYLFFLNVALVTLVYANIAISQQLLRFNSLKKHFPQIYRSKRFENGLKKSSLIWNIFPWFWLINPCFSLISLTGKSLQKFPWIPWFPWSVGTLMRWTLGRINLYNSFNTQTLALISICNRNDGFRVHTQFVQFILTPL